MPRKVLPRSSHPLIFLLLIFQFQLFSFFFFFLPFSPIAESRIGGTTVRGDILSCTYSFLFCCCILAIFLAFSLFLIRCLATVSLWSFFPNFLKLTHYGPANEITWVEFLVSRKVLAFHG